MPEDKPTFRQPQEQLGGCCWLPRLKDKILAGHQGQLPLLYRLALGSSLGIDGHFLRHFQITFTDFRQTVLTTIHDEELAKWFQRQPTCTPKAIQNWNTLAPKLGTAGNPGYLTRHVVKFLLYPKSITEPVASLFEAITQDERM